MDSLTPALQTYSIIAAAFAAGTNLSTVIITYPALLHATGPTLLKQWHLLYNSGIIPVVSLAVTSAAGFATLAYRSALAPHLSTNIILKRNLYAGAAVGMLGLAPYTLFLMGGVINELSNRAESGQEKAGDRELVQKWGTFAWYRGIMLYTATAMGTWASVAY